MNTWTKWEGNWVVKGSGNTPAINDEIVVTKASGERENCKVNEIVLSGTSYNQQVWLAAVRRNGKGN